MTGAIRPEDATGAETEEMSRKVRDLVNYLANYDDPSFEERMGMIKNPKAVLIMVQSEQKFERGLVTSTTLTAVGSFNPVSVAVVVRDWLQQSEKRAMMGREIR